MEDILASIKKIIAEDGGRKLAPTPPPRRVVPRDLEVDEMGERLSPVDAIAEDDDILELDEAVQEPAMPTMTAPAEPAAEIVSEAATQASRSALSSLSKMIVKPEVAGADTLEALAASLLKPMLKEWLDTHLPAVVERLVAQEVARISGRGL